MERRHYDEMRTAAGEVRAHFRALADWLAETPAERVAEKRREADLLFHRVGITFAVYGDDAGAEQLHPLLPAAGRRAAFRVPALDLRSGRGTAKAAPRHEDLTWGNRSKVVRGLAREYANPLK